MATGFCFQALMGQQLPIANSYVSGDKSFADDLNKERGIVSCRVALLLRYSDIKPLFKGLFQTTFFLSST